MAVMGKSPRQWLLGLIILIIGTVFLLENLLGIVIWEKIWLFWPTLFVLWSLMEILQKKSIFFGLILLSIGVIFLLKNLDLFQTPDSILKYWPVIIIAMGLDQLIKRPESDSFKSRPVSSKGTKKMLLQDDEII